MNESQWQNGAYPDALLAHVRRRVSKRKLRLYACACCRRIEHKLTDERSRRALEVSEQFADGLVREDLRAAHRAANSASAAARRQLGAGHVDPFTESEEGQVWQATRAALRLVTEREVVGAASEAWAAGGVTWAQRDRARKAQAPLVREIFGNPFRPVSFSPEVLAWHDGEVVRLAQAIYDRRLLPSGLLDHTRLLILADALEEAGCTDQAVLDHCRRQAEHFRGCWLIDQLTGRE
jgi:hypothetical protein